MSTEKLYLLLPDTEVFATVAWVSDDRTSVRLDRTVFHPKGGGQPADLGFIEDVAVTDVRHGANGEVDHKLFAPVDFLAGDRVRLRVDPLRRGSHTAWHTAGHLVAEAVRAIHPNWVAMQGHHWPGEGRVEFDGVSGLTPDLQMELNRQLARLIGEDLPIGIVGDPYHNRNIRIGQLAAIPCGGTHASSTGALKAICITKLRLQGGWLRASYSVN